MLRIMSLVFLGVFSSVCGFAAEPVETRLVIRTRAEWGARPFLPEKMKPHAIDKGIIVHHSEGRAPKPGEEDQVVRAVQNYHMNDRKWGDAAYHYFICPSGIILQGRPLEFAGDSGTNYDTRGYEQICMLGSYMKELPTPEALKALSALVQRDMKALGFKRDRIFAHRELAQTDCPGHALYQWYKDVFKESLPAN